MLGRFSVIRRFKLRLGSKLFISKVRLSHNWAIHPAIGISRLGDALITDEASIDKVIYEGPTKIGELPKELNGGGPISTFRVSQEMFNEAEYTENRVRRQCANFKIFNKDTGKQVSSDEIESIKWTVWLANKKAAFYDFTELRGNPMLDKFAKEHFGLKDNGYDNTMLRNSEIKDEKSSDNYRKELIIDFGPRSVFGGKITNFGFSKEMSTKWAKFDEESASGYQYTDPARAVQNLQDFNLFRGKSLPNNENINYLGEMVINDNFELHVVGGLGKSVGITDITTFAGGDGWWDDISDGPVEAEIVTKDGTSLTLHAWCVIGSPKYAPELVNITSWNDVIYDMAVRFKNGFNPLMVDYQTNKFKLGESGFYPNVYRDIQPLFRAMRNYTWTANVAPMVVFANPPFDICDISTKNDNPHLIKAKQFWFNLLRSPFNLNDEKVDWSLIETDPSHQDKFAKLDNNGIFPLMPAGCGDNPVMDNKYHNIDGRSPSHHADQIISKFLSFSPVQYYMLYQWANGFATKDLNDPRCQLCDSSTFKMNELDIGAVGNCVGYPASPGIEVTWNVRNPSIYEMDKNDPWRIKLRYNTISELELHGLNALYDECRSGEGCEPGDLTKRMAIPWQADFADCTVQTINFSDPDWNRGEDKKPAYYSYWWPAQAPMNVYLGYETKEEQTQSKFNQFGEQGSGEQVSYHRGVAMQSNPYAAMIKHWKDVGFIWNKSKNKDYPYFVECERNFDKFTKSLSSQASKLFESVEEST